MQILPGNCVSANIKVLLKVIGPCMAVKKHKVPKYIDAPILIPNAAKDGLLLFFDSTDITSHIAQNKQQRPEKAAIIRISISIINAPIDKFNKLSNIHYYPMCV